MAHIHSLLESPRRVHPFQPHPPPSRNLLPHSVYRPSYRSPLLPSSTAVREGPNERKIAHAGTVRQIELEKCPFLDGATVQAPPLPSSLSLCYSSAVRVCSLSILSVGIKIKMKNSATREKRKRVISEFMCDGDVPTVHVISHSNNIRTRVRAELVYIR